MPPVSKISGTETPFMSLNRSSKTSSDDNTGRTNDFLSVGADEATPYNEVYRSSGSHYSEVYRSANNQTETIPKQNNVPKLEKVLITIQSTEKDDEKKKSREKLLRDVPFKASLMRIAGLVVVGTTAALEIVYDLNSAAKLGANISTILFLLAEKSLLALID